MWLGCSGNGESDGNVDFIVTVTQSVLEDSEIRKDII